MRAGPTQIPLYRGVRVFIILSAVGTIVAGLTAGGMALPWLIGAGLLLGLTLLFVPFRLRIDDRGLEIIRVLWSRRIALRRIARVDILRSSDDVGRSAAFAAGGLLGGLLYHALGGGGGGTRYVELTLHDGPPRRLMGASPDRLRGLLQAALRRVEEEREAPARRHASSSGRSPRGRSGGSYRPFGRG